MSPVNRTASLASRAATRAAKVLRLLGAAALILVLSIAALVVVLIVDSPDGDDLRARAGELREALTLVPSEARPDVEELRLVSTSGLTARCAVRGASRPGTPRSTTRPNRAPAELVPERRAPAFLIVAGYETGRLAVTFPEVEGVILLACDYPFAVPARLTPSVFARQLPAFRQALIETTATVLLALDYLHSRADVDTTSVAIVGASVGVPFATVVAALDKRTRGAALLYGGGDLPRLFTHNVDLGPAPVDWLAARALAIATRPIEPTRYAGAIAPRPVLAVNARNDPFIPPECVLALHRALADPKEIRWLELDHFAAFHEAELLAQLTGMVAEWFREQGIIGGVRGPTLPRSPAADRQRRSEQRLPSVTPEGSAILVSWALPLPIFPRLILPSRK